MQLFLWLALIISLPVMSHQTSRTASLKELKWNYTNVPLRITNSSSTLPAANNIIDQSLAEWNSASSFKFQRGNTGVNQITFTSDFSMYGSAVVGLTELGYATSGTISSARVLLNEQHYNFVESPGMAYGNNIYLKDVVTHELGHFVGLGHSEVLNSTMFYQTFPGQSEISADDKAGIRNKYDSNFGKISGYIMGGSHIGILGVHVQAISRKTGEAISSTSDQNGYFEIGGLDLGDTYYLYTSKLKFLEALPSYFANVQTDFCPASYVSAFFSQCGHQNDGIAQGITLTGSQKNINVGEVSINCTLRANESYLQQKISSTFNNVEVYNYGLDVKNEKSYTGYFNLTDLNDITYSAPDKLSIDLSALPSPAGKNLKIRLISQPFGNPIEYSMVVKKAGFTVAGSPYSRSMNPEGTLKLDLVSTNSLTIDGNSNTFEIEISARKLSNSATYISIPDPTHFASLQTSPYLLVMSVETGNVPELDTGLLLSDNHSCLDAPFTYAVANSTAKSDETSSGGSSAAAAGASCGTIDPPSGPGPGSFMGIMSLGFLLSALSVIFVKRGKNFLS